MIAARRLVSRRLWAAGDYRAAARVRAGIDDGCWAMFHARNSLVSKEQTI